MTLVCVSVQIGSITKTSRTNIKVERIASPALRLYKVKTTRDDTAMYLKPSLGVKQAEWVALTPGNWKHYIDIARGHHQKCRTNKGIRRATGSRIQDAARAIDGYLLERGDVQVGPIARTYWETTHTRQPEGTAPSVPDNVTFRQMQHLDSMRPLPTPTKTESNLQTITVQLNGSSDLQLSFNVRELRTILVLPNHNLLAEGVFSSFDVPAEPTEDMVDEDHIIEEE
ncbi:uncharacterized protein PITG_16744 [Phytophthora infestans T30-4]|uniref:Uncharacterized protein n=1 Tax=Phytophthora infestans (strain T30-4) TaxID=403677 RepID=D0NVI6_PHYIT|nr:uncharacterized protein PITG_16744 [Phytophthora infestans T30-4]EEY66663.1 conserved hypothetical protein [Phytophthora infestans T30-4]|eukprot:XP_002896964.1 conserved hypothetical protein [Phytophthora infestans T30-4]